MDRIGYRARWPLAMLALGALIATGCAYGRLPRIDPSGERLFIPGPLVYEPEPSPPLPHHERHQMVKLTLAPGKIIAPVGSEVVLLATVCGADGCMYANQEVEWMLAPGGAGQFIALGRKSPLDWLVGFSAWPRKVNSAYAIGVTSSRYLSLTRGTPTPSDDLPVQRGQAWISLTSPVEGVSFVTAHAPSVHAWDGHVQTAIVHWVDAEFVYPPPAINPAGSKHVFTTTVTRHSTHAPAPGWRVRYEITGGPPAGFSPDGAKVVEIPTDELGQASAEIYQLEPSPGTNTIGIQVIRPADATAGGERLVVGSGFTQKTWSTPGLSLRKTGPARGVVGDTLVYRIEVRNPGDLTSKGIVVTDQLSEGLTFLSSNPPVQPADGKLQWTLGDLLSGEGRTIEVNLRAERPGTLNNCASAASADNLTAQDCAATTVVVQSLRVEVTGPPEVAVGGQVRFEARITNMGDIPATGLVLVDRYDAGLRHTEVTTNPIERGLPDLQPGETRKVDVTFIATQPGELCHTVEVQAAGGVLGSGKACVTASPAANEPPAGLGPASPASPASPAEKPDLVVRKTGPAKLNVGDTAEFKIEITNRGPGVATNLKVVDHYDPSLRATAASEGSKAIGADLQWLVDELPAGKTAIFEVNCECLQPATKACNRVTVTCQEGVRDDGEACLTISPPPGGVSVTIAEKADPLQVGGRTSYEIQVANQGQAADGQVTVVVIVPKEMTPLRVDTKGPSAATIDGQTVSFAPVAELRPGDVLSYSVQVRAVAPGDKAACRVEVTSRNLKQPLVREEETRVIPGN